MRITAEQKAELFDDIVAWAKSRKAHIEADDLFTRKAETVLINAPVALMQVDLKAQHKTLTAVLKTAKVIK